MIQFTAKVSSRLDGVIAKELELSRSFVNVLLDQGKVQVDSQVVYKASRKVHAGDVIELDFDPQATADIPNIKLDIIYEDDDCLVVIKPEGVLTHSKGVFNPEATVSTFIRPYTTGMEDNRGGIVHRLDRVTSGLLICAKNDAALKWLQEQFAERKVNKTYVAVVTGQLDQPEAVIDMPIERNPKKPQTFRAAPNGKKAVTTYKVLRTNDRYSLLELHPQTGRTHQLRVHLAQLGHPIVGDVLYGGQPADRTYLHALALEITLPNQQHKTFTAPLPDAFEAIIK